jgi:hypothetical protein
MIWTTRLLVLASRLIRTSSVEAPALRNTTYTKPLAASSGLNQMQIEKEPLSVMVGSWRCCGVALDLASPLACAKYATFCRSVSVPGWDATEPVFMSGPETPEASTRKALGWKG